MADSQRKRRRIKPGPHAKLPNSQVCTAEELRRLFNDNQILQKARSGEFSVEVEQNNHPSPPRADEPICTMSQLLVYRNSLGKEVARAHQYLRPDGTVGA